MSHKSHRQQHSQSTQTQRPTRQSALAKEPGTLQVVLKADARGTLEAIVRAIRQVPSGGVPIEIIEQALGDVSKSDLSMALTGSRLAVGFDVDLVPRVEEFAKEHGVEIRLYNVVDHLARDLGVIARSLVPAPPKEKILGRATVVALFKSTRKGIILGCEVREGKIAVGMPFRVIGAPGTIYVGRVESLHIEETTVTQAKPGQRVGVKIHDFKEGHVGDIVECFETERARDKPWAPKPGVTRLIDA